MTQHTSDSAEQLPRIRLARSGHTNSVSDPRGTNPGDEVLLGNTETTLPLIAEFDGQAVASINLTLAEQHVALIHGMWIDPAWVETTLPIQMIVAVLDQSRRLGCLKVDMDPGVRDLAVIAMLLDSGLLMHRSVDAIGDDRAKAASCYLNLYQDATSLLA